MDAPRRSETIEELRHWIRVDVRGGFADPEASTPFHVDCLLDGGADPEMLARAREILREELESLRREQESWPEVTDCDRLDAAFRALRRRGILARHYYGADEQDGLDELRLFEMSELRSRGRERRGYVFYSMLDMEGAIAGIGLYLAFGAAVRGARAAQRVGAEVAGALRRQGLEVSWDGRWDRRIRVDMVWRRRARRN